MGFIVDAAQNIGGAYLSSSGENKRSRTQKKNQATIDDILAGLRGEGPYADMFAMDQDAFQQSYVEPAKAMFENQISPQIQQSFIASGLQRGTGLDDTLTRAGVDLDAMINSAYMDYLNNTMNRRNSALNQVLGADVGGVKLSNSDRFNQAAGGYLLSDPIGKMGNQAMNMAGMQNYQAPRPGFSGGY